MVMVTNKALGPRGFNVGRYDGDDKRLKGTSLSQVVLQPGESRDIDLHDAEHPAVKAMVEAGHIEIGGKGGPAAPAPAAPKFNVDGLNEVELRAFIKERSGKDPDPKADKAALQTTARSLAA